MTISAHAKIVSVNVESTGADYKLAVFDGLKEAVARVSGLTIDAEEFVNTSNVQIFQAGDNNTVNLNNFNKQLADNVKSKLAGVVKSYDVISHSETSHGSHKVELNVKIEKYEAPGINNDQRRSIAVLPFKTAKTMCGNGRLSDEEQKKLISDEINRALVASRRFAVLDRDETDSYNLEKELVLSEDTAQIDAAKLGNVKAADYILTGSVKKLNQTISKSVIALTGEVNTKSSASIVIDFKVLVFATRQIKFASSVEITESGSSIAGKSCLDVAHILINKAAEKIVKMMIDDIYPLIVVRVNNNQVYLNMGGESIKEGQTYTVNEMGEKMIDPYTGESLGAEENTIATIQISDVKPKFSVAKVINGDISNIKAGQVCRAAPKVEKKPAAKPSKPASAPDYSLPL